MNTMEQIDRMVWNSDLDIADKLAWQEAHTDYVSSLLECKSIAEQENLYEFSLMAAGTTSFIPKIGKPASVMVTEVMEIGLGPTHIRNSYQRPTLETKRDLAEKLFGDQADKQHRSYRQHKPDAGYRASRGSRRADRCGKEDGGLVL